MDSTSCCGLGTKKRTERHFNGRGKNSVGLWVVEQVERNEIVIIVFHDMHDNPAVKQNISDHRVRVIDLNIHFFAASVPRVNHNNPCHHGSPRMNRPASCVATYAL